MKQIAVDSVIVYHPDHLHKICLQPRQSHIAHMVKDDSYSQALTKGPAFTAIANYQPIICAGVLEQTPGRAFAWSVVSCDAGPYMVSITIAVKDFIAQCKFDRVEAVVRSDFDSAIRWANILGFKREGLMRKWMNGLDFYLYSIVRD